MVIVRLMTKITITLCGYNPVLPKDTAGGKVVTKQLRTVKISMYFKCSKSFPPTNAPFIKHIKC
jgi:hypothetical protein